MKWYNPDKGFGFIDRDRGGKDIFVHVSALTRGGLTELSEGQRVAVDMVEGGKGPEAVSVRLIWDIIYIIDVESSLVWPERRKKRMSGTKRLPGGEWRKASQRNRPARAAPSQVQIVWREGDPVKWKDRTGLFRREVGDNEHAEIAIAERVYRVKLSELG